MHAFIVDALKQAGLGGGAGLTADAQTFTYAGDYLTVRYPKGWVEKDLSILRLRGAPWATFSTGDEQAGLGLDVYAMTSTRDPATALRTAGDYFRLLGGQSTVESQEEVLVGRRKGVLISGISSIARHSYRWKMIAVPTDQGVFVVTVSFPTNRIEETKGLVDGILGSLQIRE